MNPNHHNTRRRTWEQLNEIERYKIETLLKAGHGTGYISKFLSRDRRTIQREIKRGSVIQRRENPYVSRDPLVPEYLDEVVYLADAGQRVSEERASNKGRGLKIGHDHELARYLEHKIGEEKYSPDAALAAVATSGKVFAVRLCTKTVYNMITRGDFLNLTNASLPEKGRRKRRKHRKVRKVALNNLKGRSIEERPAAVDAREELGHWEMDLVVGSGRASLLVMTERVSRNELLIKLPDKRQESVVQALDRLERRTGKRFPELFKSLTMDNGSEFLDCKGMEASCLRPGTQRTICYYAHPYSAWERGSNENANKLIRRFIPKGTDIGKLSNQAIKRIEHWMNNYPRRLLGYRTAKQAYQAA